MSKKKDDLTTTVQIRLHPTPEQSLLLMAHCTEYISTVNALVQAQELEILPDKLSTKDFSALLPSAVKNQALRDAQSVYKKSIGLGVTPVLRKPICQWNNQNWQMTDSVLTLPVCVSGKAQQMFVSCHDLVYTGKPGLLRIKRKRGKWIADVTFSHEQPIPVENDHVMGIDLGIKVPAVSYTSSVGARFFGNGRYQRYMRRRFYSQRKKLQKAKKTRAVKSRQNKESRWMRDINHKLSRQIVNHAQSVAPSELNTLQEYARARQVQVVGPKPAKTTA